MSVLRIGVNNQMAQILQTKTVLQLLLLFYSTNYVSQRIYKYNAPGSDCYSEMIFEEKSVDPRGIIVIDTKGEDISTYSQKNPYLNSSLFEHYNFLYINILNKGNSAPLSCFNVIIRSISSSYRIFPSAFYVIVSDSKKDALVMKKSNDENYGFNIIYDNAIENEKLLTSLNEATRNQDYKIPIGISFNSDDDYEAKMSNYKRNLDVGFYLSPLFLTGKKLGLTKGAVTHYGLTIAKNIGAQFTIKVNFGGSFKKPDQSSIQSGMQSKIQAAIRDGKDSIYIDQTLSGHIMFGGDFSLKYYFEKVKRFRPYVSAGIGSYRLTNISGRIQDTIDISGVDASNPSSMQGLMGGGGASSGTTPEGMSNLQTRFLVPQVEVGFEYRLAPAAKLNISMPFRYFVDRSSTQASTFTIGLNFGLSFTVNPNKFQRKLKVKKT
jgi:hypothetical protein